MDATHPWLGHSHLCGTQPIYKSQNESFVRFFFKIKSRASRDELCRDAMDVNVGIQGYKS